MKIFKTIAVFSMLFYFGFDAFAQQRQIKIEGEVYAEVDQKPLESATVYIENPKDSTLISYSITDENGQFSLQEYSSLKQVRLKVSFVGFNSISKLIEVKDAEIQLDRFFISENSSVLSAVELTSERAPVQIRKDTIEFNANAFKTKKDATVEDLLKKLPGVEIDKDGVITVNGTEVKKIMVNGKTFFGDDPTIATKNLTKDMIESVQISDSKTKDQAFTGDKGNPDEKMINLTIKKEKNKGDFGRIAAGLGTDKRYEAAGLYNHFDNDQRISVLAGQ
ncbi:MAG: carboxypeptidase-like regulatory domain-containing protein, partial [Flavobacteriales bacterium]